MIKRVFVFFLITLCEVCFFLSHIDAQQKKIETEIDRPGIRRFIVVVGSNKGGKGRMKLQYAVSDARAFLGVLEKMGGVFPDDSRLLVEPDRETFLWEMDRLKERIRRIKSQGKKVEMIFYYSGHSDEKSLLLGYDRVSYTEFKDFIKDIDADVRITILDSCASGAFTLLKGGKKKDPFLLDNAYDMKGYAVMTSSSSDEASQESDLLGGSFFSHYLVTGLRGAADVNQDGRITLNEVYQYSFNETLAKTAQTMSGPQHPNYNIQMSGTGDVVITDIRKSTSILRISKNVSGRIFIHDQKNTIISEFTKAPGRSVEFGLDEGKYRIIAIVDGNLREAKIQAKPGKIIELEIENFEKIDKIDTVARGDLNYDANPSKSMRFKHFSLNGRGGIAVENHVNRESYVGMCLNGGISYRLNRKFSIEFLGGYYHLPVTGGDFSIESIQFTLTGRYHFLAPRPLKPFINAGLGMIIRERQFDVEYIIGGGVEQYVTSKLILEVNINLLVTPDWTFTAATMAGWRYRF